MGDLADFLFDQDKITEMHENSLREEGRKEGIKEGKFGAVDRLVTDGVYDMARACKILGVDIDAYRKYKAGNAGAYRR